MQEVEDTRQEQARHDKALQDPRDGCPACHDAPQRGACQCTGLIPGIRQLGEELTQLDGEKKANEVEKRQLQQQVQSAAAEHEAHRAQLAQRIAAQVAHEAASRASAHDVLQQAEDQCAAAAQRADALREAITQLAGLLEPG